MKEHILIVLGSKSDLPVLKDGFDILKSLNIPFRLEIVSAHRNADRLRKLCKKIDSSFYIAIAAAGKSAALPGFIASYVNIPVIGVALKGGVLEGLDALFSIISAPKGLGLTCSGIGKSAFLNAIIFSLEVVSLKDKKYFSKLKALKKKFSG